VEDDPRDGKELPANRGLLRVTFDAPPDAQVYLLGKPVGQVGQKIDVPCGRSFIRVGKMPGPMWLSQGQSVYIQCRLVTDVSLPPQ
jgi:eukaryotic-like serine/threonine-protein kinase